MEIEKIINSFNQNHSIPYEAINSAIEQKTTITPLLLNILKEVIDNYEAIDLERIDYIIAMSLLAKFRETGAFDYIIKIAQLPQDWTEYYLDDYILEGLASCIVSTYDGDLTAIKSLIENVNISVWCRAAGLSSLLGLISIGKLSRSEVIEYFRYLFSTPLIKDSDFGTQLVSECNSIYPEELYTEISKLFKKNLIDSDFISKTDIEETLNQEKEEHLQYYIYKYKFHNPVNDVIDNIRCLYKEWLRKDFIEPNWEIEEIKKTAEVFNHPNLFPYELINSALEQKDTLTPTLLKIIDQVITNYDKTNPSRKDYIMAMLLLSKFKEPLAFDYILKFAELPLFWTEYLLGDIIEEKLTRFIISTYNGNLTAIKSIIENISLTIENRIACLRSLVGLYAMHRISREEINNYFRYLYNSSLTNNIVFTTTLVALSYAIFPDKLFLDIIKMFNRNLVNLNVASPKTLNLILQLDKEKWLKERVYTAEYYMPIEDVIKEAEHLYAGVNEDDKYDCCKICDSENKRIKISRNELCPCESGRKYKKCCLKN